MVVDAGGISTPSSDAGSRSWRLLNDRSPAQHDSHEGNQTTRRAWDRDRLNLSHRY
jgi:hypothetical protein